MRNVLPLLSLLAITVTFTSGCAGPEEKLGRGIRNTTEVVRLGELRRSVEQTTVWDSPSQGATTGFVKGVNMSLARTGLGLYEIITFPLPPYHPIWTKYLTPLPAQPDNRPTDMPADALYSTDQYIGITGGTILPFIPGNQFSVYGTGP